MRSGPLFWAKTRLGAAMLAMPAPATPPTKCRRDIVIGSSPEHHELDSACSYYWLRDLSDGSHK
jgi:hypothetical protein